MATSPFIYFTDAVLRGPTIGCMLMCLSASLVGVVIFLRKQSLLGEALSHAAYPGVMMSIIISGVLGLSDDVDIGMVCLIIGGAIFSSIIGLLAIGFLERRMKVRSDSALCFVLSSFFGIGLTLASQVQFAYSSLYRQGQIYLYGQAATMSDIHIVVYGILSLVISAAIWFLYKEIQTISFDRDYARSLGINIKSIDVLILGLVILAVVIGIRSVGVVLMSAMLIAPAVAARQYTNKLNMIFVLSALFGLTSGFFGNYLSIEAANLLTQESSSKKLVLATGPMIVLVASAICLFSLMFAPERGFLLRIIRIAGFRYKCLCENTLKVIWKYGKQYHIEFSEIAKYQNIPGVYLRFILYRLKRNGWIFSDAKGYQLTSSGVLRAARIVRLHRLWEVYLAENLGVLTERVHLNAEEMEHVLTPELERQLTLILKDPAWDPHNQPIPKAEKGL